MITRFVEVTDGGFYGKFLVARMDPTELRTPSAMPEADGHPLLTYCGRRYFNSHSTLVVDLQRGTGASWPLQGVMDSYLHEKQQQLPALVCPLYFHFVGWLYADGRWAMGAGHLDEIPRYIDLRQKAVA